MNLESVLFVLNMPSEAIKVYHFQNCDDDRLRFLMSCHRCYVGSDAWFPSGVKEYITELATTQADKHHLLIDEHDTNPNEDVRSITFMYASTVNIVLCGYIL